MSLDPTDAGRARYARLKALYFEAIEMPSSDRDAWLDECLVDEPALREQLEALLGGETVEMPDFTPPAPEADDPRIGESIGPYRIEARIGGGGMGVVYKSHDARLARPVALKFLAREVGASAAGTAGGDRVRFLREARAASALDHPNICTVYELGETDDGQVFLAMAYYAGETLESRLARGPLPWPEAVALACQVASGLAAAHKAGIVHRDIKSSNLILTEDGVLKILDFGIAKLTGHATLTATDAVIGTPSAMAPEQVRAGRIDAHTDVWGLGCTLYQMLTGEAPFGSGSIQSLLYAIVHEPHPPVHTRAPETPAWLGQLVDRCLAKRPEDRYADGDALHQALEEGAGAGGLARPARSESTTRRWSIAMVIVLSLGAAFALVVNPGRFARGPAPEIESVDPVVTTVAAPTSLGVLPFAHDPADAELGMLAAGLAARISDNLTPNEPLTVIAPSSIAPLVARSLPVAELGARLGVDTVVTGRIERAGDGFRIMMDLIDASTGLVLEGTRYEVAPEGLSRVEGEAAGDIVEALLGSVAASIHSQVDGAVGSEAYRKLLVGIHLMNQTRFPEAVEPLQAAVDLEPELVPAWSALSRAYAYLGLFGMVSPRAAFPASLAAAERALGLDPTSGEALAAMAQAVIMGKGDIESARSYAERAVAADPGSAFARYVRGATALGMDQQDRALEDLHRALALDPLAPSIRMMINRAHLRRHDWDAVVAASRENLALHPFFPPTRVQLALAYWYSGRRDEAIETLDEDHLARRLWEAIEAGELEHVRGVLQPLAREWRVEVPSAAMDAANLALGYAMAGDAEAALDWMERCRAPTDRIQLLQSLHSPVLDPLRSSPRFRALLESIGAPASFGEVRREHLGSAGRGIDAWLPAGTIRP